MCPAQSETNFIKTKNLIFKLYFDFAIFNSEKLQLKLIIEKAKMISHEFL